ncbi:MAG: hypothetical protein JNL58_17210 [Planctomyces sp.]|nr:hypothetical protein [Planctomyces sp.]
MASSLPLMLSLGIVLSASSAVDLANRTDEDSRSGGGAFEIRVIDRETKRGIPLAEVVTVDDELYVTDSAGRVAIEEPLLTGETVFFYVRSPGYRIRKDGFGIDGVRISLVAGGSHTIELDRIVPAERLYRITGRNLYRDSIRLGKTLPEGYSPETDAVGNGRVVGQDSVQVASYRGSLRWFWGDTNRLSYPLGLFRTAGAVTPSAEVAGVSIESGLPLKYFTDSQGFARAMADHPNREGVMWIDGVCTVMDGDQEVLIAHYSRRKGLAEELEHGLLRYDDSRETFQILKVLDLTERWRFVRDHPIHVRHDDVSYLMFGNPFPTTRVPATLSAITDSAKYESYTCEQQGGSQSAESVTDIASIRLPHRDSDGKLVWQWQASPPMTQQLEQKWLAAKLISDQEVRFLPQEFRIEQTELKTGQRLEMHGGTVYFNAWRKRWVMIAILNGMSSKADSFLGEVYYSESESPQGPFERAFKIATHPKQSFYNPCHHPFFDAEGGRVVYFEGTYTNSFTTSPATPGYNYNQLMYRLDLRHPDVARVFDP